MFQTWQASRFSTRRGYVLLLWYMSATRTERTTCSRVASVAVWRRGKSKFIRRSRGKEVITMLKERLEMMRKQYAYKCADGVASITIGKEVVEKSADDLKEAAAKVAPTWRTVYLPDAIGSAEVITWVNARADEVATRAKVGDMADKIGRAFEKRSGVLRDAAELDLLVLLYACTDGINAQYIKTAAEAEEVANTYDAKIISVVAFAKYKGVPCPFKSEALFDAFTRIGAKQSDQLKLLRTLHKWSASGWTAESRCAAIVADCNTSDVRLMREVANNGFKLQRDGRMEIATRKAAAMSWQFNAYLLNRIQHFAADTERMNKVRAAWEADAIAAELPELEKPEKKPGKTVVKKSESIPETLPKK